MSKNNYREMQLPNQSGLKHIKNRPSATYESIYGEKVFTKKKHFDLGASVECLLVYGEDAYKLEYSSINEGDMPSEALLNIHNQILRELEGEVEKGTIKQISHNLSMYSHIVGKVAKEMGYQPRWKDATREESVTKSLQAYHQAFFLNPDKTVVTDTTERLTREAVANYKESEIAKYYQSLRDNDEIAVLDKVVIVSDLEGMFGTKVTCKGELDSMVVDTKAKRITILDYKALAQPEKFISAYFFGLKYYFQAIFYAALVKADPKYTDYTIDFEFVIIPVDGNLLKGIEYSIPSVHRLNANSLKSMNSRTFSTMSTGLFSPDSPNVLFLSVPEALYRFVAHTVLGEWSAPLEYFTSNRKMVKEILFDGNVVHTTAPFVESVKNILDMIEKDAFISYDFKTPDDDSGVPEV